MLCWKDKYRKWEDIHPNEEVKRLFTVYADTLLTENPIYYKVTSTLSDAKDFPFSPGKKQKNTILGIVNVIFLLQKLDRKYMGMTAMFTHRFTDILKDLE